MKTLLMIMAVVGLICSVGTVLFVEFFVGWHPTYEAATSFGVISIAATSFYRAIVGEEKLGKIS